MILWGFPQTDVAKITDEVYMEVVVGSEDPGNAQQTIDNASLSKDFMPVALGSCLQLVKHVHIFWLYSKFALCSFFHNQYLSQFCAVS